MKARVRSSKGKESGGGGSDNSAGGKAPMLLPGP